MCFELNFFLPRISFYGFFSFLIKMKLNFKIFNKMEIFYLATVVLSTYCTFPMSTHSLKFGRYFEEMQLTSMQGFRTWGLNIFSCQIDEVLCGASSWILFSPSLAEMCVHAHLPLLLPPPAKCFGHSEVKWWTGFIRVVLWLWRDLDHLPELWEVQAWLRLCQTGAGCYPRFSKSQCAHYQAALKLRFSLMLLQWEAICWNKACDSDMSSPDDDQKRELESLLTHFAVSQL